MSDNTRTARAIDWSIPVCTIEDQPRVGVVQSDCPVHGVKRVMLASPSSLTGPPTVFRYREDGRARGDGAPSPNDLTNFDWSDQVSRIGAPQVVR